MVSEREPGRTGDPTLDDLREGLTAAYGTDYGAHDLTSISRYTDTTRQAETYRDRRVLLAGDAAHVHGPQGGQGLNIGVQDAVNLGWKLAQVVRGTSPASLLDTYHAERHPIGARVLRDTMAMAPLFRGGERVDALREILTELLAMDEPRIRLGGMMSGLDVHYDLGEGHPLLGRRMPDLDLATADGPIRAFTLLHGARPLLLNLGEPGALGIAPWADRVRAVDARYAGPWELPVIGEVRRPGRGADPARRPRRLGGRRDRRRARRRAHGLVRGAGGLSYSAGAPVDGGRWAWIRARSTSRWLTMPATRSPSRTGRWRKPRAPISSAASAMVMSGVAVTGSAVIHSAAVAVAMSAPEDAARSTSRSVTMPTRRSFPPSTTRVDPNRALVMAWAISAMVASAVTRYTDRVMMSPMRTVGAPVSTSHRRGAMKWAASALHRPASYSIHGADDPAG